MEKDYDCSEVDGGLEAGSVWFVLPQGLDCLALPDFLTLLQRQGRQSSDDRNDDQYFDECEGVSQSTTRANESSSVSLDPRIAVVSQLHVVLFGSEMPTNWQTRELFSCFRIRSERLNMPCRRTIQASDVGIISDQETVCNRHLSI